MCEQYQLHTPKQLVECCAHSDTNIFELFPAPPPAMCFEAHTRGMTLTLLPSAKGLHAAMRCSTMDGFCDSMAVVTLHNELRSRGLHLDLQIVCQG